MFHNILMSTSKTLLSIYRQDLVLENEVVKTNMNQDNRNKKIKIRFGEIRGVKGGKEGKRDHFFVSQHFSRVRKIVFCKILNRFQSFTNLKVVVQKFYDIDHIF